MHLGTEVYSISNVLHKVLRDRVISDISFLLCMKGSFNRFQLLATSDVGVLFKRAHHVVTRWLESMPRVRTSFQPLLLPYKSLPVCLATQDGEFLSLSASLPSLTVIISQPEMTTTAILSIKSDYSSAAMAGYMRKRW